MWVNHFQKTHIRGRYYKFYEPLKTTAPSNAHPYCCYIRSVYFYRYPYIIDKQTGSYQTWDIVETEWSLLGQRFMGAPGDDLGLVAIAPLVLDGELIYELAPGYVEWIHNRWYMIHGAYRVSPNDWRWEHILAASILAVPLSNIAP